MQGDTMIGICFSILFMVLGWKEVQMRTLTRRVDELDTKKLDHAEFHAVRQDLKEILEKITDLKVEQALWRGRAEQADLNKRG